MSDPSSEHDVTLFVAALDHAWSRFNFRVSSALQILNYYLVAVAIFSAAYVAALAQNRIIAASIGFATSIVTVAALLGGYSQIRLARLAMPQLRALEDRIAIMVAVPRISEGIVGRPSWIAGVKAGIIATITFSLAFLAGLGAAAYALFAA